MEDGRAVIIRLEAGGKDLDAYCQLRTMLWPTTNVESRREAAEILATPDKWAVFLAYGAGTPLGFVEVRLREYAEGASSSPVGFLEGWYVVPQARKQQVGRTLVQAAEEWARSRGCTEMASNTEIDRTGSIEVHKRLGYEEVERDVCFLKKLL